MLTTVRYFSYKYPHILFVVVRSLKQKKTHNKQSECVWERERESTAPIACDSSYLQVFLDLRRKILKLSSIKWSVYFHSNSRNPGFIMGLFQFECWYTLNILSSLYVFQVVLLFDVCDSECTIEFRWVEWLYTELLIWVVFEWSDCITTNLERK